MTILPDVGSWYLLESLIEWVKLLAVTHIGFRFVRAYAARSQHEHTQRTLEHRVRELEQLTETLGAHVQQVLDAERFAVALMLERGTGPTRDAEPAKPRSKRAAP
jgi:hypothetical protein